MTLAIVTCDPFLLFKCLIIKSNNYYNYNEQLLNSKCRTCHKTAQHFTSDLKYPTKNEQFTFSHIPFLVKTYLRFNFSNFISRLNQRLPFCFESSIRTGENSILRNYLFKHYSKAIIFLRRKLPMRKHLNQLDRSFKENRYDQFTNLGIDLEAGLNKSIILPKIYNKIAEIQASQYVRQRRAKEDRDMYLLKDEIDKLRKKIYHLDEKKIIQRFKTEDVDSGFPEQPKMQRYKQSFHLKSNDNIRNSEVGVISRYQRNTDKDSLRRQDSSSIFIDKSPVKMTSSVLKVQARSSKMDLTKRKDEKNTSENVDEMKGKNKKNGKPNGKLKRKFRVIALVVYFSLFLPAYAKKHYQNRLKLMMQQYPHQVEKYSKNKAEVAISKYKMDEAKLWNYFDEKLNILDAIQKANLANFLAHGNEVKMIKDHFQFLINNQLNSSEKQFKQQHTIQQQILFPKNTQYLLQGFQTILTKFIDTFISFINKSDFFLQRWKTFSLGIMNNSFVHNSHPKLLNKVIQSGIIRLHPFKEVLLVYDQQTQCMLLGYDIICRIFAYKWMVRLEKLKNQSQKSEEVRMISSFMVTLLYLTCQNTLDEHIKIYIKDNGDCERSVKTRNKNIRSIVPLLVKSDHKRDEKLLKTNRLISNPPLQNEAIEVIENNGAFVLTLQAKIKAVGYALFQKLKIKMTEQNALIKSQTLNDRNVFDNTRTKRQRKEQKTEIKQMDQQANKSSLSIQKRLRVKKH